MRLRSLAWLACVLTAGCSSALDSEPGKGSGNATGGSGAGGSSAGAGSGVGPAPAAACPEQVVPWTPLRRLTRFEYQNAVHDLLDIDASAAADLPADEVTNSFDNNAGVLTVSALHAEKYVLVAEALAKLAVADVQKLAPCAGADGEEACARDFAKRLARRAFRRAATAADQDALMQAYAAGRSGGSYAEGIEVMLRAALQSPSFLYRLDTTAPAGPARTQTALGPYDLATRLSFLIWASGPDDALLDAALRGELSSKAQVASRARQMLADPRARRAVTHFFEAWSGAERLGITTKSTTLFPSFSMDLRGAMAAELGAFVEHVLWEGDHTLKSLLTEPVAYVNAPLAELYGVSAPAVSATGLTRVQLPSTQDRAGLLTQAGFLSVQAHPDQTSPVLRGKFVRTMLLCDPPPPPPNDVDITLPPPGDGKTARERLAGHLDAGASCSGCHALMDPIGLAFEHFDAMGRYRADDQGAALDVSGQITGATDPALGGTYSGARELALKLAASNHVRDCVATHWFRFAASRSEADADQCSLGALRGSFAQADGDFLELVVATTQTDAFWFRSTP